MLLMQSAVDKDQSFAGALGRLLLDAVLVLAPLALPLLLSPPLAWLYLSGTVLFEWAEERVFGRVEWMPLYRLGACIGVSYAVAQATPSRTVALLAGVAVFAVLVALGKAWEKLAGLSIERPSKGPTFTRIAGPGRPSGRPVDDPAPLTPEGGQIRMIGCHEVRNSAPLQYDYLFPDGSVLFGAGAVLMFSPDGRYCVSPMPTTGFWGLLIYDRRARILYRFTQRESFVALHAVTATEIHGWGSRVHKDGTMLCVLIDDVIAHACAVPMVNIGDLMVPAYYLEQVRQLETGEFHPAPAGGPVLTVAPYLPQRLMALADPVAPLADPWVELIVNGAASGLIVSRRYPRLLWSSDARGLVCIAKRKYCDEAASFWYWNDVAGWSSVGGGDDVIPMQ
nr:hypothetical protein VDP59_003115 [Xanthomonas campestris pv. campestris]